MIKTIATASFVHGAHNLKRGQEAEFTPATFTALAAHGLVREKTEQPDPTPARTQRAARAPSNKKAPELQNQAAPDAAPATDAAAPGPAATEGAATDAPADSTAPSDAPADTDAAHADQP